MELLDRYLQAVRQYLIGNRREDIVKELGDNILSQMEDRAAELGRPLNEIEQAAILKQYGHPLVAAARYRRLPLQQLIGPALFPLYWYALQAILAFVALLHVMAALVLTLSRGSLLAGMAGAWGSFWLWALVAVGALTVTFGMIEYFGGGKVPLTETFNPLELPAIKKAAPPRDNSAVELVFGSLFLVAWPVLLHSSVFAFGKPIPFRLAPVWWHFEIPILLVAAMKTAAAYISLFRPQYPRLRAALKLTSDIGGIVTFYLLLRAGEFFASSPGSEVSLSNPVHIGDHVFTVGQIADWAMSLVLLATLIGFFFDCLVQATRLVRTLRRPEIVTPSNGIV